MGRHRTLDTVVASGERHYHCLEKQLSFSKEVTSLKHDGTKESFFKDNTIEKIVGNASGVFTVQSIRRRSADDRYDVETLMSGTRVPWDPQATKLDEVPLPQIVQGDQQPLAALAPQVQKEKPKKALRRLYITKRD